MDMLPEIVKLLVALIFVISLMGGLAYILKKLGFATAQTGNKNGRLQIVESKHIDARRKLVLIKRDNVEHLIMLGGNNETVIETGIESVQSDNDDKAKDADDSNA